MAPPSLLLLLLLPAAGAFLCHECPARVRDVCLSRAATCNATGGLVCSSDDYFIWRVRVLSAQGCSAPAACSCSGSDSCSESASGFSSTPVPGVRRERSCCNGTLCNGAALPRLATPPALGPALGLALLLGAGR